MAAWLGGGVVQLSNLVKDESYLKSMQYEQLIANRKLLNVATQGRRGSENPFFADLLANKTTPEKQAEFDADIAALEAEGVRELSIAERSRLAGEEHRYESVYRLLAQQSHHNLNALGGRHVVEVGGRPRIAFFKKEERGQLLAEADTMAGMAANAVALVSELIDATPVKMEAIGEALEAFRTSMLGELSALKN